jgi:hypothetical protein
MFRFTTLATLTALILGSAVLTGCDSKSTSGSQSKSPISKPADSAAEEKKAEPQTLPKP